MTWEQVPKDVQGEVVRLAEGGQFHPDRHLRRLAHVWAAATATESTWFICLSAVMSLGGGSYDLPGALRDRRWARAIVALGEPDQPKRPEM